MSEKKKYIVEAGDDIQLITLTGVKDGSAITLTGVIDTLETAEKLEEEAYERGHDTGYKKCLSEHEFDMPCSICDDYERGLNDAWDVAKKLAMMGLFTALAMIFGYVEAILPISIGIPGVKLGLANIVVVFALYRLKPLEAFWINVARIVLISFMFGNLLISVSSPPAWSS